MLHSSLRQPMRQPPEGLVVVLATEYTAFSGTRSRYGCPLFSGCWMHTPGDKDDQRGDHLDDKEVSRAIQDNEVDMWC